MEYPAVQLITDEDGKVAGAVGRTKDGKGDYVRVNASKGVLIATGNIANDDEMKECFCPIALDVQPLVAETHTGDGHKMALWVGADMDRPPFALGLSATNFGKGVGGFYAIPFLRVNKTGRRYCNETFGTHELAENQPLANADCTQPDHTGYQIVDARYQQAYEAFGGNWERMQAASLEELGAGDEVVKADSLEALAEALGMDAPFF